MKTILPGLVQAKRRQVQDEAKLQAAAAELVELDMQLAGMVNDRGPDPIDALIQSLAGRPRRGLRMPSLIDDPVARDAHDPDAFTMFPECP